MCSQAVWVGLPLAGWLVTHPTSRVVACFKSTVLLQGEDGQPWGAPCAFRCAPHTPLWAITVYPNPGAFRMVVPHLPTWTCGTKVEARAHTLGASETDICWEGSALWDPYVRRRALSATERYAARHGLAEIVSAWDWPEARGFWNLLADVWDPLAEGLCTQDRRRVQAILSRLVGCGPGLTPTGDDFVQALLVTLATGDMVDRQAFRRLAEAVTPLVPHTTPLSQMFLQEACQGWAFGPLKLLLESLPDVSPDTIHPLLTIGASSGPAYTLGVLFALTWQSPITNYHSPAGGIHVYRPHPNSSGRVL